MTRRCPRCGGVVPPESLNCPTCFAEVPRTDETSRGSDRRDRIGNTGKSHTLTMILAIIPAFIGLLGLGQIYQDPRDRRGWRYLVRGFITYVILVAILVCMVCSIWGILLLALPLLIVGAFYLLLAGISIFEAYAGSVINFRRR